MSKALNYEALGLIHTGWEHTQAGFPYAIYRAAHPTNPGEDETNKRRKAIFKILEPYDAISLELAATAHYLRQNGYEDGAWEETRRRKTVKATTERVEKAQQLLAELGL